MSEETLALEEDLGFEEAPGDLTEGSFEVVQDFLDPTEYDMSTQEADPELVEDPLLYEELDDEVPTVEVEEDPEAIVLDFTSNAPTGTTTPYTPDDLDVEESGVEGEVVQVEAPTPGAVNQAPEFDQDFTPVGYEPAVPTTLPPEYQAAMEQMKFETGQAEEVIFETQAEVAEVRADAAEAHGLASDATLAAQEAHNAAVDAQNAVKKVAAIVRIDSSKGVLFKHNNVETVLTVTVFRGDQIVTDIVGLWEVFGPGAYLEWQWQRLGESTFSTISSADPRIGSGGFTFTLTPDDVDTKVVFRCILNGE